jgi:hypothetical protein
MDGYACILPFDSQDERFARGFEAGRLWGLLQADPDAAVVETVNARNAEMVIRMAEAAGRAFEAAELVGDWLEVRFQPAESAVFGSEGAE